ncbi:hypothetical protein C1646_662823 [Rhizophagus diaphanus]|nr:hypothetical protein C1646_662823 [Rhizophagus diaphanus] [Rhizophagus sp. MUCL 43196]
MTKYKKIRMNPSSSATVTKKKKPPNGFSIFFKMYTPYIKQQFPNYSSNEIMKEAAHQWNNTPQDLKNSFLIYAADEGWIHHYVRSTVPPRSSTNIFDSSKKEKKEVEKDCHHPDDDELFHKFINMP